MDTAAKSGVVEVTPQVAWDELAETPDAVLIDVRTRAEWAYVGIPDTAEISRTTLLIEWRMFPDMKVNEGFLTNLMEALGGAVPAKMFFLCRSGVRSLQAADQVGRTLREQGFECACINVAEGFEGDLNEQGHRGSKNGWKVQGLAWKQS